MRKMSRGAVGAIVMSGFFLLVSVLVLVLSPGALDALKQRPPGFKFPDLSSVSSASFVVQIHFWTALGALLLGPVQLILPKGGKLHRTVGTLFVGLMGVTAVLSLFIKAIQPGEFSSIHIFSVMTLIALPVGMILAKQGKIVPHAATMVGLYIGLVIAGVTAVAPGRILWEVLVAAP